MSLKGFHIFFLIVSILLLAGFGAWALREYLRIDSAINLLLSAGSFVCAIALLIYGRWFLRKVTRMD